MNFMNVFGRLKKKFPLLKPVYDRTYLILFIFTGVIVMLFNVRV